MIDPRHGFVGQSITRIEDERLLRGAGRFVDDVDVPGQLWMRVVRSTQAHGRIRSIETSGALAIGEHPRLIAVFGQKLQDFVDVVGGVVLECCRLHGVLRHLVAGIAQA
jgi:CO/xanthine dehydrogenase Mo-binding subunit